MSGSAVPTSVASVSVVRPSPCEAGPAVSVEDCEFPRSDGESGKMEDGQMWTDEGGEFCSCLQWPERGT